MKDLGLVKDYLGKEQFYKLKRMCGQSEDNFLIERECWKEQ